MSLSTRSTILARVYWKAFRLNLRETEKRAIGLFSSIFFNYSGVLHISFARGVVASWLVRSSQDRAVRVRALAGDTVLRSRTRHFTLTVPLSTQVDKWVPANLMLGGNPAMDKHPIQEGVEILLVASCYRNGDKLRPGGPLGSYADLTFYYTYQVRPLIYILFNMQKEVSCRS